MRVGRFIGQAVGTTALLGALFCGGVMFRDLRTVRDVQSFDTVMSFVPARLSAAVMTAAHGQAADYSPYDEYADVLKTLQDHYYGLKDYAGHFGGTGAVLSTNKQDQVIVAKTLPGTPAAQARLMPDDIITSVDGTSTTKSTEVDVNSLLWGDPGTTARLTVLRPATVSVKNIVFHTVNITVSRTLMPKDIDTTQMTYNGIRGMMGALKDRYTRFFRPDGLQ